MKLQIASFLAVAVATATTHAFVPNAFLSSSSSITTRTSTTTSTTSRFSNSIAEQETDEEVYGTVVGDTKGAALRLEKVAISRGANPLLKNIDWSVQPNERWGIVGVNGAGKSTLLGAITGTVRMDEGHAFVHSNIRVGYLKQSVSSSSSSSILVY